MDRTWTQRLNFLQRGSDEMSNKNYQTGIVCCTKCGAYIGNYLTGDYYKLIRTKYCPTCKVEVRREQKRDAERNRRVYLRKTKSLEAEKMQLLQTENAALRVALFGTDSTAKAKKLQEIFRQLANME